MPAPEFESWSEWLPCNRMLAASSAAHAATPGIQPDFRLSRRLGRALSHCRTAPRSPPSTTAAFVEDGEIAELAGVIAEIADQRRSCRRASCGPGSSSRRGSAIASRSVKRRSRSIPSMRSTLHVTHGCISHLMTLFPATAGEFPEADAYNRAIRIVRRQSCATSRRHITGSIVASTSRCGTAVATPTPPSASQRKIDMFAARAMVPAWRREIVPRAKLGGVAARLRRAPAGL